MSRMTIVDLNGSLLLRKHYDSGEIVDEWIGRGSNFRDEPRRSIPRYEVYYPSDPRYASFNRCFVGPIFLVRESGSKIDAIFQLVTMRDKMEVVYHYKVAGQLSRAQIDAAMNSKAEVAISYVGQSVSISSVADARATGTR